MVLELCRGLPTLVTDTIPSPDYVTLYFIQLTSVMAVPITRLGIIIRPHEVELTCSGVIPIHSNVGSHTVITPFLIVLGTLSVVVSRNV